MKTFGITWLFCLCFVSLLSQNYEREIDSLLLHAKNFHTKNQDSTLFYASLAQDKALSSRDTSLIARSNYILAHYLVSHNEFEAANRVLTFNFVHQKKLTPVLLGSSYYTLGTIFYLREEWDAAIENYLKALAHYEIAQNSNGLARTNLQLSVIYSKKGDTTLTNHFADASLYHTGNREYHNKYANASTLSAKIEQLEEAIQDQVSRQDYNLSSQFHYTLGKYYLEDKKFDKSIENFEKSIEIKKKTGYQNLMEKTLVYLAEANYMAGNFREALKILDTLGGSSKRQQPLKIAHLFTETYQSLENYKLALYHNKRLRLLQDSINQLDENVRIAMLTSEYNTQEKEAQIQTLQQANVSATQLISNQKKWWFILAIITFFLLITTLWWNKRSKQSKKLVIETLKEKEAMVQKVQAQHLLLKSKAKIYLDDLYFVKADGNYVEFHSVEKKMLERDKLKEILEKLPPNFIRVHRSYVVNENQIASYNSSTVFLKSGQEIPLSRTYRSNLK
jgi:tetratricopeptide (TPR) repeat protein